MTYAEFLIRLHAYRRKELSTWYKVREIAYYSLIGSHMNPKKLPKTKEKFMPLKPKNETTAEMLEKIQMVKEAYLKEQKQKENG